MWDDVYITTKSCLLGNTALSISTILFLRLIYGMFWYSYASNKDKITRAIRIIFRISNVSSIQMEHPIQYYSHKVVSEAEQNHSCLTCSCSSKAYASTMTRENWRAPIRLLKRTSNSSYVRSFVSGIRK